MRARARAARVIETIGPQVRDGNDVTVGMFVEVLLGPKATTGNRKADPAF